MNDQHLKSRTKASTQKGQKRAYRYGQGIDAAFALKDVWKLDDAKLSESLSYALIGAGQLFDHSQQGSFVTFCSSDAEAIRQDWEAVATDLWQAIASLEATNELVRKVIKRYAENHSNAAEQLELFTDKNS